MKPPKTLAKEHHETFKEIAAQVRPECPVSVVESITAQVATSRDCRRRIDRDGTIVADSRGNPVPHPAIALEAAAQKRSATLLRQWCQR